MTLKNAALPALIGTILMTALLLWTFVITFLNVLRDLVPAVTLFSLFIYAFGCWAFGCWELRSLRFVDCDRVSRGNFVEFAEIVFHHPVIKTDHNLMLHRVYSLDGSDVPVETPPCRSRSPSA